MTNSTLLPEHFVSRNQTDERYDEYSLSTPVKILGISLTKDDAKECFNLALYSGADLTKMLPVVSEYIKWLGSCKEEIIRYFNDLLEEALTIRYVQLA
ncbi:MAG: hypothetical protein IJO52_05075 [Clostridia bacterium]|nr:hypothetical protein [Clostridia bacterium]